MKLFGDKLKGKVTSPPRNYGNSGTLRSSAGSGNKLQINTKPAKAANSVRNTTGRGSMIETKPVVKQESFLSTLKPIDKNLKGLSALMETER